jgi:hypothetical protein
MSLQRRVYRQTCEALQGGITGVKHIKKLWILYLCRQLCYTWTEGSKNRGGGFKEGAEKGSDATPATSAAKQVTTSSPVIPYYLRLLPEPTNALRLSSHH